MKARLSSCATSASGSGVANMEFFTSTAGRGFASGPRGRFTRKMLPSTKGHRKDEAEIEAVAEDEMAGGTPISGEKEDTIREDTGARARTRRGR